MKNEKKIEKVNRKRMSVVLVVVLLLAMITTTAVGCGKPNAQKDPSDTSEVVSEVSSTSEVSESTSEELSTEEVVSEEVSEEVSNEVEYVNFSNVNELLEYLEKYNRTTIVQYDFSEDGNPQAIIPNGGYYTIKEGRTIRIIPNKEVYNVQSNADFFVINSAKIGWAIYFKTTGTDLETSFTVNYADGTSEDFTIYVTVE